LPAVAVDNTRRFGRQAAPGLLTTLK
jgi:hypothetical protein